jgi:hypothetical protein
MAQPKCLHELMRPVVLEIGQARKVGTHSIPCILKWMNRFSRRHGPMM